MTLTYYNDINVYFHMKNHYKMLKNVKSVVDTSVPQSLLKSPMAMSSLDKRTKAATNEHLRKIYNTTDQVHTPKRRGVVKKHNCLLISTKSEASLRPESSLSRPNTRRNFKATPVETLPIRSYSMGPSKFGKIFKFNQKKRSSINSSTRTNNSETRNSSLQLNLQSNEYENSESMTPPNTVRSNLKEENDDALPQSTPSTSSKPVLPQSSEEHEYLLFLLRITEDIISNDFYSNSDIKKIFKTHLELNKDRLNMRQMRLNIANLCKELNIECKEYEIPDVTSDESDSPGKFQNCPTGHNYILNNNAFKSCQDCSVIRTSSLYKMHNTECCALGDHLGGPLIENIGDSLSISPSLLKLLEKLSLGRVSECTEPIPSTSAMHTPKLNVPNIAETEEINNFNDSEKDPMDFDTFVKELNSKKDMSSVSPKDYADFIALESPPAEINSSIAKENNAEIVKSETCVVDHDVPLQNLEIPKISVAISKSHIELTDNEINSHSASEKYESEFEKCSSYNNSAITSSRKSDKSEERLGEKLQHIEQQMLSAPVKGVIEFEEKITKTSKIPLPIKDKPSETSLETLKTDETKKSSKSSVVNMASTEPHSSNIVHDYSAPNSVKNKRSSFIKVGDSSIQSPKSVQNGLNVDKEKCAFPKQETVGKNEVATQKDDQNNLLKIILQGAVNDDDYIMIKGPVYVYKPLLNSDPKLIMFADNDPKSRRGSLDSQHSHRTFTVDHSHVLDEAIQFDTSLHSVESNRSMDNILKLTKAAYSQFIDMKLLQSDYDLTPEKDESDNKYHHLMVDATTSISGVNITESLLLNDDYLVKNNIDMSFNKKNTLDETKVVIDSNRGRDINNYIKFEPKMYENNYVIHRKLVSSASMPKLCLDSGRLKSDRSYARKNDKLRSTNVLNKISSSLIDIDVPSQDSSLRSEGEALQNYECRKNGIAWSLYYNKK